MRRYGELSRGAERSSPRQFFPDCTIAMCGYDFREGQVSWPLRLRENLGLLIGSLARTEPVGASVAVAGRPRREFRFSVQTGITSCAAARTHAAKIAGELGKDRGYEGFAVSVTDEQGNEVAYVTIGEAANRGGLNGCGSSGSVNAIL
jgi:hypothetical protein